MTTTNGSATHATTDADRADSPSAVAFGSAARARGTEPSISVAIPTRNGGRAFARCLEALRGQSGVHVAETIVIDSGSRDGTPDLARERGATVVSIEPEEFNHGGTRNRLVEAAGCETVLMMVQDAVLTRPDSLRALVDQLYGDPSLAAVTARQTPGRDADLYSAFELWINDRTESAPGAAAGAVASASDCPADGARVDNVCAVIRRSAWEAIRFRELDFAEDVDFGLRAAAVGWRTAISHQPLVAHHHDRDAAYVMARAAVHRFEVGRLLADEPRGPAGNPSALKSGIREVLREVAAATGFALSECGQIGAAELLDRVARALAEAPPPAVPRGELARLDELLRGLPIGDPSATATAREQVLHLLESPPLRAFARRNADPMPAAAAGAFVARLVASKLGRALGEALFAEPDAGDRRRYHDVVRSAGARSGGGRADPARITPRDPGPGVAAAPQVTAVLGMHRSGTSVAARVLNLLGIDFGSEASMLPPLPANPLGYWEQRAVMELNDEVLEALGGDWSAPPSPPAGWQHSPALRSIERRARQVVDALYGHAASWGWKDPRMSVTLPFWERVVPDMRYVVCVRNPVDVARSLTTREGDLLSPAAASELWLSYTAAALAHTAGRPRHVLFYEDFFADPQAEVDRLATFAGRRPDQVPAAAREQIAAFVDERLWHHRTPLWRVMSDRDVPGEAQALYLWLLATERGPSSESDEAVAGARDAWVRDLAATGGARVRRERERDALVEELAGLRERLADAEERCRSLDDTRRELERHREWLAAVERSASWRLTAPMRSAKAALVRGRRRAG